MAWTEVQAQKRGRVPMDFGAFLANATADGTPLQPKGVASKPSGTLKKVNAYIVSNHVKGVRVFCAQETDETAENYGLWSVIAQKI